MRIMTKTTFEKTTLVFSTWFGSGYAPVAPGTAGSLTAIPLVLLFSFLNTPSRLPWYILLTLAFTGFSVFVSDRAEKIYGKKDDGRIVIDEVAGMLWTCLLVPVTPAALLLAFLLFRASDIVKPFPAGRSQDLPGGWGITIDDAIAGMYACASFHAIRLLSLHMGIAWFS